MVTKRACLTLIALGFVVATAPASAEEEKYPTGFTDTPQLPGGRWKVSDDARPRPPVVEPGARAGAAPSDATILFDGKNLDAWQSADNGGTAGWKVENGYMQVVDKAGDIATKQKFGPDYQLHVEFAEPSPATGKSQGRGNSGVFLAGLYEVQVLDSYDNYTYADGEASAIYGQTPPLVNPARPPGEWQTYDIVFESPRFADGKVTSPGYVTVIYNGVVTQNHTTLLGPSVHRALPVWKPHDAMMPLQLQDHHMPVRFRNIWIRPLGERAQ